MRTLFIGALSLFALNAQANVIQYFTGISYNNPSELFKVKEAAFIFGGTGSYADLTFKGSAINFNTFQYETGNSHSRTYNLWPYGRIAKRINDKAVIALDVTEPFNSNLNWGTNSFTKYAVTQNYLTDLDISPKISYAVNKQLQIGGGVNFNFLLQNEINWVYPTGPSTYSNLVNKTRSFGLGYNLGATFIVNDTNFIGATYYSRIKQNATGYSVLGNYYSGNLSQSFYMPATTIVSYVHIFNPTWLVSLQAFQSEWDDNQQVRMYNTAVPAPNSNFFFDMSFDRSYALLAAVRNQFTEKLGITLAGMVDDGPEKDYLRTIVFPSEMQYFLGLIGDYHVNANTTIELIYGRVFSYPSIQNRVKTDNGYIPFTTGFVNINANVLDLKIKIEA